MADRNLSIPAVNHLSRKATPPLHSGNLSSQRKAINHQSASSHECFSCCMPNTPLRPNLKAAEAAWHEGGTSVRQIRTSEPWSHGAMERCHEHDMYVCFEPISSHYMDYYCATTPRTTKDYCRARATPTNWGLFLESFTDWIRCAGIISCHVVMRELLWVGYTYATKPLLKTMVLLYYVVYYACT